MNTIASGRSGHCQFKRKLVALIIFLVFSLLLNTPYQARAAVVISTDFRISADPVCNALGYHGDGYNPNTRRAYKVLDHLQIIGSAGVPDGYNQVNSCITPLSYWSQYKVGGRYPQLYEKYNVSHPKNNGAMCGVGNPINPAIGNKFQIEKDISIGNTNLSPLIRYYNSSYATAKDGFGAGWSHTFSQKLFPYINESGVLSSVTTARPDGRSYFYTPNATGGWKTDADTPERLERVTDAAGVASGWRYVTRDENIELYDESGSLLSITDRSGLVQSLTYDTQGLLVNITGPYGHQLTLGYDANNRIMRVIDLHGGIYRYTYDNNFNLTSVAYPDETPAVDTDNPVRQYLYEDSRFPNALTGIIDENGHRYATWAYDSKGRAINSMHANGQESISITYNSDKTATVTDSNGAVRTYTFTTQYGAVKTSTISGDPCSSCGSNYAATTYDTSGFVASKTDFNGNTTTYINDARGLELSRTEAAGTLQARTTTTEWHFDYRLPVKITRPSIAAGQSAVTSISYGDSAHPKLPTSISRSGFKPGGSAVTTRTISLQYTREGRVSRIDGPRTDVADITTMSYYPNTPEQGFNRGQLKTVSNALGHSVIYDSYDAHGNIRQMTDANGTVTSYNYDVRQRLLSQTVTPAQGSPRTTTYTYDGVGQLLTTTSPDGVILTYTYDAARYLRSVSDNMGNRIEYSYDLKGNRTQEVTKDPDGVLVRLVDTTYDNRDRVSSINAAGSLTQLVYDAVGNLSSQTDPNNNPSTTHDYDPLNRLMQSVDALSGTTAYDYDVNDRVTLVTAPNNAQTSYAYDDLGNLLTESSPDRGVRSHNYDAAGSLVTLTDARGISVNYSYDALGRVLSVDYPGTIEDVSFSYDAGSNCGYGIGRLCGMVDESGNTEYSYDAFGNVARLTKTELGISYTTQYAYDAGDNIISMIYPGGRVANITRDAIRRVTGMSAMVNGVESSIVYATTYRADNLVTAASFGNGITETRSYDLQGRLQGKEFLVNEQSDTQAPVVTPPAPVTVEATDVLTPVNLGMATATDDVDGALVSTADNIGPFPLGVTTVTWSATDAAGNVGTATQTVTVKEIAESIPKPTPLGTFSTVSVQPSSLDMLVGDTQSFTLYATNDTGVTANLFQIEYNLPRGLEMVSVNPQPVADRNVKGTDTILISWQNIAHGTVLSAQITLEATVSGDYVLVPDVTYKVSARTKYYEGNADPITISVGGGGYRKRAFLDKDNSGKLVQVSGAGLPLAGNNDEQRIVLIAPAENDSYHYLLRGPETKQAWQPLDKADALNAVPDTLIYVAGDYLDVWQKQTDAQAGYRYRRVTRPVTRQPETGRFIRVAATGSSLESRSYAYDANGNVLTINTLGGLKGYGYDALDRLVIDALPGLEAIALDYDANGNRTSRTQGASVVPYNYQLNSNVLSDVEGNGVTHDAVGNRTSDRGGNRTFEYNQAGRLFKVYEGGSLVATYTYNALGQRTRKVTASGTSMYHYDQNGQIISETHSDGRPIRDYVWRDNEPVAQIDVEGATETVTYLHTDHLSTPRLATDADGVVVWHWQGEAFGSTPATGSVMVNLRFPGQYYDGETGLHYNWNRYYDPSVGRYITSDPIGLEGGLNSYAYGLSNPSKYFDSNGLEVRFICRLLDSYIFGDLGKKKHCFVYVSCPEEGWTYILSLFQSGSFGALPTSGRKSLSTPRNPGRIDRLNSPRNRDNIVIKLKNSSCGSGNCDFEKDIVERFLNFPSGDVPYSLIGPNSNSFAAGLVTSPEFGTTAPDVTNAPGSEFGLSVWR